MTIAITNIRPGTTGVARSADMTATWRSATVVVDADPDQDDCLSAAAAEYLADHPELAGYDLAPQWADADRETVSLTLPGGSVQITLAAGEWQSGTLVTEWVPCGPSLDYWVSDPSAVPEGMADELAAAGQEALRAVDADLYDAILAVRDPNAD